MNPMSKEELLAACGQFPVICVYCRRTRMGPQDWQLQPAVEQLAPDVSGGMCGECFEREVVAPLESTA